jgi:hypothetical protein
MGLDPERDVIYFGKTDFRGTDKLFGIRRNDRRQHMYVIGKTGTGKSALLSNLIIQDIVNGEGLAVVDPHGELVEGILENIPESRLNDVIYFNPADDRLSPWLQCSGAAGPQIQALGRFRPYGHLYQDLVQRLVCPYGIHHEQRHSGAARHA